MTLVLESQWNWQMHAVGTLEIHYVGRSIEPSAISEYLLAGCNKGTWSDLQNYIQRLGIGWAFIAASPGWVIAAVDSVRSYPIFYTLIANQLKVSNSARQLQGILTNRSFDSVAVTEFRMSGYVTGANTLSKAIHQLQAGELLATEGPDCIPTVIRYYRYLPKPEATQDPNTWVDELAETTENIFRRMIESANGRQFLVPLSGGLDSRLIVCMLRHLGYKNVRTFSYGPPGNYEAKIARYVAEKVGYPWEFVPTTHSAFRSYFWSQARCDYWGYADGLCAIPNMQDIYPLQLMRDRGLLDNVIVVNGQSGDFISGGHIPESLLGGADRDILLRAITDKHFSLRKSLKTPENIASIVRRVRCSLQEMEEEVGGELHPVTLYESWEWQERQCKYVIAGQRIYDWLGLDWSLPLWDTDYLRFWSRVPYELKLHQQLYKKYLNSKNYCGIFRDFNPVVWRWPGVSIAALPVAQMAGLMGGRPAKDRFYAYARYIGHYGPCYAPWGLRNFLAEAMDVRNALPFHIDTWVKENAIGLLEV
jgi:asparagine synthase (glutamine-hydrolysing)